MSGDFNILNISDELIKKADALCEYTHKGTVSVDYIDKDIYICGKKFPVGSLACDILNISDEIISELLEISSAMIPIASAFCYADSHCQIPAYLIESARAEALKVVEILKSVKPFSYFQCEDYIRDFNLLNTPVKATDNSLPSILGEPSFALSTILNTLEIGGALAELRKMIIPIVQCADPDSYERTVCGYARLYEKVFTDASVSEGIWLPFSTLIQKHIAVNGVFGKRIDFLFFSEMLASDFVEGLKVGHAPKKCRMCGRYFLTTDAHHPHYCNEPNPDDAKGRTCRKLAKLGNSTEKAKDNPRIVIKNKALANLRQSKTRGNVTEDEYKSIYNLIVSKSEKAAEKSDYCNGAYVKEMKMKNLRIEAGIQQ